MVLAVLQRRAGLKLGKQDVYAATVGGVRLTEPSVDLAVAVALASSAANLGVPRRRGGHRRGRPGRRGPAGRRPARRLAEAERMGFRRAIVPSGSAGLEVIETGPARGGPQPGSDLWKLQVVPVDDIREALAAALGREL